MTAAAEWLQWLISSKLFVATLSASIGCGIILFYFKQCNKESESAHINQLNLNMAKSDSSVENLLKKCHKEVSVPFYVAKYLRHFSEVTRKIEFRYNAKICINQLKPVTIGSLVNDCDVVRIVGTPYTILDAESELKKFTCKLTTLFINSVSFRSEISVLRRNSNKIARKNNTFVHVEKSVKNKEKLEKCDILIIGVAKDCAKTKAAILDSLSGTSVTSRVISVEIDDYYKPTKSGSENITDEKIKEKNSIKFQHSNKPAKSKATDKYFKKKPSLDDMYKDYDPTDLAGGDSTEKFDSFFADLDRAEDKKN